MLVRGPGSCYPMLSCARSAGISNDLFCFLSLRQGLQGCGQLHWQLLEEAVPEDVSRRLPGHGGGGEKSQKMLLRGNQASTGAL
jgi:hypothetical protein